MVRKAIRTLALRVNLVALALAVLLTLALVLGGCAEGYDEAAEEYWASRGGPPPSSPPPSNPPPSNPPPSASFSPNFSEIQTNVFTPDCATSGCHAGGTPAADLNLEEASSYAMLVDIASTQDANILRVAPGNPDASYLIQKLEGTAATGQQMPAGGTPLAQADIDVIRQWITDGATDDRVQPPAAPIRVASLSPSPAVTLDATPASIIAGFDREPDATTVNANTFLLVGSGGDGVFGDANEVQVTATSISVPANNPRTAVFDLTGVTLADDTYRVYLLGAGASMILDLDANALDGEFSGSFPSGDGVAGGDFRAQFQIVTPVTIGPTLDQIQAVVFTPSCATAGCHTGPAGNNLPAGLDLSSADASFGSLVGIPSQQEAAILRVAAGDPDNSYLVQKIEGSAATGTLMPPPGRAPLSADEIAAIRQWITDGAMR